MGLTVVQLVPALEGGGVERGVVEVSQALVERGHRSVVVSSGGRMVQELDGHGAEHVELPIHQKSLRTLRQVKAIRALCRSVNADVLHARSRVPAWVGYFAWRGMHQAKRRDNASPCPAWVTSVHGLHSVNRYSRIMTSGQRVEVVSNTVRDYVVQNYPGTDEAKLVLNHRGVDPAAFVHGYQPPEDWCNAWAQAYPQLQGKFVVTLAGRLTRLKGHHDLIGAIEHLRAQGVNAHALIVGGEDPRRLAYAKQLRETVAEKNLADHVTFTGHRSDIKEVLAVSDAVVSLSTKPESFGRSVLEAVRLGRPVIGYDHGGVGEVLAQIYPPGRTPLGDLPALADRLQALAQGQIPPPTPVGDAFLLRDMLDRSIRLYEEAAGS